MDTTLEAYIRQWLGDQRTALVTDWYRQIAPRRWVATPATALIQTLTELVDQIVDLLGAEVIDIEAAQAIGRTLADLRGLPLQTLSGTLRVLRQYLLTDPPEDLVAVLSVRSQTLLDAITDGFVQQQHTSTIAAQETLHQAVLTAYQQADAARRASDAYLRLVISYAPIGLIVLDPTGTILLAGGTNLVTFGITAADLVGTSVFVLCAPWPGTVTACQQALAGESHTWTECVAERHYEIHTLPLHDPQGSVTSALLLWIDVTARVQAQAALEAERASLAERVAERTAVLSQTNVALQQANRRKDEFLATMSHELRTPLTAILGQTEILLEHFYGTLTPQQTTALQQIDQSGQHLLSLITDILDFSRLDGAPVSLELVPINVITVCQTSLKLVQSAARTRRISMDLTLDVAVETVLADEQRLVQILSNLLNNAIKFTPEGGQIGLEVQGDATNETVQFIIWDTGIGIAAEDVPRLFQPFVQLDSRLSRRYEGTGLGLALVARLVKLHGGSVAVDSEEGQGSRFTVTLPWSATAVPAPSGAMVEHATVQAHERPGEIPLPLSNSPGTTPPVIVLVEDHPDTVALLQQVLPQQGYELVVAGDGATAVKRTQEVSPAVVVMDIQLPGMDGLEAMRRIRATPALAHIPLIAVTALAMPGDEERCRAAGADAYLSKPVSLRQLVATIAAVCQKQDSGNRLDRNATTMAQPDDSCSEH